MTNFLAMKSRRGQTASIELVIGTMIILLIMITLISLWDKNLSINQEARFLNDFDLASTRAMDRLSDTSGTPYEWEFESDTTNVTAMGLAVVPKLIDVNKLEKFVKWADTREAVNYYDDIRVLLGAGNMDFEFNVYRPTVNGPIVIGAYESGKEKPNLLTSDEYYVITRRRIVTLDEESEHIEGEVSVILEMKFYARYR